MAVLTFVFLICSFRVNVIFVLLLVEGEIAFSLLAASLFVESEALRLLGNGQALQAAGNAAEAAPLLVAGENKLKIASRLTTVSIEGSPQCYTVY
jgi:succinate-acetate transporter protein